MFGKRPDGRVIRNLEPMQQIMPYILKTRTDSMNMFEDTFNREPLDAYIREKTARHKSPHKLQEGEWSLRLRYQWSYKFYRIFHPLRNQKRREIKDEWIPLRSLPVPKPPHIQYLYRVWHSLHVLRFQSPNICYLNFGTIVQWS